jgi:TonB family protein
VWLWLQGRCLARLHQGAELPEAWHLKQGDYDTDDEETLVRMKIGGAFLLGWVVLCGAAFAQEAPAPAKDDGLSAASILVGKALFLRGFYVSNELTYDASGRVLGTPKVGDWTVAAVNVLKVERRGTDEIELDGVRVAIRYNADSHEFQRHALNDAKMRLIVKDAGETKQLETAFAAMFAVGIDPALQRAMPDYWRHYFDPTLAWPPDALSGQTIYALYGAADQAKDVTAPTVEHRVDAKYSEFAVRDKVQGTLQLRLVVDANGVPQRIAVSRPLGYGLDASAVEAMTKWRFAPGMKDGSPVATGVVVEQQFR